MAIAVFNRQRGVRVNVAPLQSFAESALKICLETPRQGSEGLATLRQIDVVIVSDRRIAEIHRRYLNDGTPTDVITFQHGEIVVSAQTAKRQARNFGTTLEDELRLYLVHGLLHLHGYNDKTRKDAAEMRRLQDRVVAKLDDR
ncbi:MAG TPA: rRNA maturation RNase YbeY [Chthoniobacterales bacterium]|jgi:probable rRNA maturation factor|nr:rRNA maturation RNase YbeY [Chthoniobacterales bacterium]